MEREFLICECESLEHLACFTFFDDDEMKDEDFKFVTLSVRLKKLPFFERLKKGVKYIFGHTSSYGDYDEFIIKKEDAKKFKKVVKYLEKVDE